MKKYTILLATIILAFAACNKEAPTPETPESPDAPQSAVPFTFHATVGELTRTEISENADGSAAVLWKATDKVSVFDAAGNNCEFSVSGAGSTATLSGELVPSSSGKYYAVYPYAPSSTLSGTTVTAEIPSVQKVSGPGFADGAVVSAAVVSEEAATFCNLASLVRFTVPEDVTTLRSVTLASTAPLSGALVMDFAGGSPAVTSVPDHATTVTVEMEDGSALPSGNYYAAVLPGSHKLTVTLTDLDGMTAERAMDEAREFASSHIRGIGSVKADTFDNVEFVLGDAAFTGETKTLIMSAKVPAGTYTMEQLLGVTSYQYKGDKAISVIDNLSFTVGSTTEKQTISVAKSDLTARHLLVREGDDLQAVLDAAEAGLDDVYVGAGTFTGGFTMAEDINVTGSWNDDFSETITYEPLKSTSGITTILDGGGSQRVVNQAAAFTESTVTTWKNLKIQNGSANTGAGAYLQAYGILDGCEITGNTTTGDGAGVVALNWATTTRCYIHHNTATGQGGGIVTRYVLSYSVVDSNQATGSGGAYVYAGGYSGENVERPRIFNCIISNNKATNDNGGGVRANRGSSNPLPVLYNLLVVGNTATGWAGSGILVNAGC
ncbi:MAG: right-handed parallel beta-helix repeat-containing protein, partial [Bacteroidales bacterium]|nr:right-handed parallel beta-helix repeat-containing protein [Bacteroidales bacterium]